MVNELRYLILNGPGAFERLCFSQRHERFGLNLGSTNVSCAGASGAWTPAGFRGVLGFDGCFRSGGCWMGVGAGERTHVFPQTVWSNPCQAVGLFTLVSTQLNTVWGLLSILDQKRLPVFPLCCGRI